MSHPDLPAARPRLPDTTLPAAGGAPGDAPGGAVALRAHRRATVVVLAGAARDAALDAYLRALAAHEPALRDWDGRVLVVVPDAAAAPAGAGFPVAVDERGRVAAAAGVAAPALVVADQWGEVHVAQPVAPGGAWMAPAEVEQWLRMLAIRCAG